MVTVYTLRRTLFVFIISLGLIIFSILNFNNPNIKAMTITSMVMCSPILIMTSVMLFKMYKKRTTKLTEPYGKPKPSIKEIRKEKLIKLKDEKTTSYK